MPTIHAHTQGCNRLPSQYLLDQRCDIWQISFVPEIGETAIQYAIQLFLSLLLCFGKAEHSGEENVYSPHCRISARYTATFVSAMCQLHDASPTKNGPAKTVPAVSLTTSCCCATSSARLIFSRQTDVNEGRAIPEACIASTLSADYPISCASRLDVPCPSEWHQTAAP